MPENLAKLSLAVMCKAELLSDELGYGDKDISKQSVEGATWFILPVCSKMWEERDKLREELWNKGNRTWWKSKPPPLQIIKLWHGFPAVSGKPTPVRVWCYNLC